ncbi:hypothetical protein DIPPA_33571 [Diplonema papillatum]|nr:hypothetical protein DIPPA_33571 [Diplonema papillatum]
MRGTAVLACTFRTAVGQRAGSIVSVDGERSVHPGVRFSGKGTAGLMTEADCFDAAQDLGAPPPVLGGWDVRHEWGTSFVEARWAALGFDVRIQQFFGGPRIPSRRRTAGNRAGRRFVVHSSPDHRDLEPRSAAQAPTQLDVLVGNSLHWTLRIPCLIENGVLVPQCIYPHHLPLDSLASSTPGRLPHSARTPLNHPSPSDPSASHAPGGESSLRSALNLSASGSPGKAELDHSTLHNPSASSSPEEPSVRNPGFNDPSTLCPSASRSPEGQVQSTSASSSPESGLNDPSSHSPSASGSHENPSVHMPRFDDPSLLSPSASRSPGGQARSTSASSSAEEELGHPLVQGLVDPSPHSPSTPSSVDGDRAPKHASAAPRADFRCARLREGYPGPNLHEFALVDALMGGGGCAVAAGAPAIEGVNPVFASAAGDEEGEEGEEGPGDEKKAAKRDPAPSSEQAAGGGGGGEVDEYADGANDDTPEFEESAGDRQKKLATVQAALKRSVFRNLTAGHVLKQAKSRPIAAAAPPFPLRHALCAPLPVGGRHVSFVTVTPEVTDSLFDFLDTLGVNDPNLLAFNEVVKYIGALEDVRHGHGVMHMLQDL